MAMACYAYTPINKRSWINFRKVKAPKYNDAVEIRETDIIHAKQILIEEHITALSKMVHKSLRDFHKDIKKYTEDIKERIKRATKATSDYGFVKKPELWHQYGMLFNHHG